MALPLAITGCGLVSSVGRGMVEACASIRAGINRVKPVTHFSVIDLETQAEAPLKGHPVAGLTDGFGPSARWLAMGRHALADLLGGRKAAEVAKDPAWSRCGVVFVLPVLDDARFFHAAPARPEAVWSTCLDPLLAGQGLTIAPMYRSLVQIGAGGIAQAFELASAWLEKRAVERVLVVAVDSLLDAWSLNWLATGGRLKDAENPVGLAPGEAAVALVLERATSGREEFLARVKAVAFEEVDQPFQNAERRQGRGLVAALRKALAVARGMEGDLYVNLNGEEWRAAELGNALTAMPAGTLGNYRLVVPAVCVGDVGAAAGALHIACAVRSFARGYAAASQAWIIATSDYGDVSTLCLEGG